MGVNVDFLHVKIILLIYFPPVVGHLVLGWYSKWQNMAAILWTLIWHISVDYPLSLTNADILGQGNLNLVREKSGKSQGILLSNFCGNPAVGKELQRRVWLHIKGLRVWSWPGPILSWRLIMKLLLRSFSSLLLNHSRRVVVSYKRKCVHEVLVNCLFKLAQEKVWLGELTVLSRHDHSYWLGT